MPSCSGPIPAQKYQGRIFLHNAQNGFLLFLSFSLRKDTLNCYITCHVYINNHKSPLKGPIKNDK